MKKTLRNAYINVLTNLKKSNYFIADVPEFIVDVIYNGPATIVFWSDGSKTVVKCTETDEFDWEKGLAMAISKHYLGKNFKKNFKFYQPKDEKKGGN